MRVIALFDYIYRYLRIFGITNRLRFWATLLIIFVGVLNILPLMMYDKNDKEEETISILENNVTNQSLFIENWISERSQDIRFLANLPMTRSFQFEEMHQTFEVFRRQQQEFQAFSYINKEGYMEVDTVNLSVTKSNIPLADREYFKASMQGHEFVSDILASRTTGEPVIVISAPVKDREGNIQGVVFGSVKLATINKLISQFDTSQSGETGLISRKGYLLSDSKYKEKITKLEIKVDTDIVRKALAGEPAPRLYTNYMGEEVYGAYQWIKEGNWLVISEISKQEALYSYYRTLSMMLIILVSVILVMFFFMVRVSNHLLQPLRHLLEGVKNLKKGDYSHQIDTQVLKTSPTEFQQLCKTFNQMSATIYQNRQQLEETNLVLQRLSSMDDLTDIANRRSFDQYLHREWKQAKRSKTSLSLIMLDVDYFKQYNDTYGHQAGDQCLQKVAQVLESVVQRPRDLVARYGGEEFAIILPETDVEGATLVAEQIRRSIEELRIPHKASDTFEYITISLGVTSIIPNSQNKVKDFVGLADRALYQAKEKGRNKVEVKTFTKN